MFVAKFSRMLIQTSKFFKFKSLSFFWERYFDDDDDDDDSTCSQFLFFFAKFTFLLLTEQNVCLIPECGYEWHNLEKEKQIKSWNLRELFRVLFWNKTILEKQSERKKQARCSENGASYVRELLRSADSTIVNEYLYTNFVLFFDSFLLLSLYPLIINKK